LPWYAFCLLVIYPLLLAVAMGLLLGVDHLLTR